MGNKKRKNTQPKQAKLSSNPLTSKTPIIISPRVDKDKLIWSFRYYDTDCCWGKAENTQLFTEIVKKLKSYERKTINEIRTGRRDHSCHIDSLCPKAQKRLRELNFDDIDKLFRLRFMGEQRLWGVIMGNCFIALWWDPTHEVCISHKKHT